MAHQFHEKIVDLRVHMLMEDMVTLGSSILGVYLYCASLHPEVVEQPFYRHKLLAPDCDPIASAGGCYVSHNNPFIVINCSLLIAIPLPRLGVLLQRPKFWASSSWRRPVLCSSPEVIEEQT